MGYLGNLYKIFRGTTPDDGTGTPARDAANGLNSNMDAIDNAMETINNAAEKKANKATNLDAPDNTTYPTTQAVENRVGGIEANANNYTDTQLQGFQSTGEKGQASGYAPLDASGKVPVANTYAAIDEIVEGEYINATTFNDTLGNPVTPGTAKIYQDTTTGNPTSGKQYRWGGSQFVEIIASPGTTDEVSEGTNNLYHTAARVRATVLTGIDTVVGGVISASDSILSALGKLQAQITSLTSTVGTKLDKGGYTGTAQDIANLADQDVTSSDVLTALGYTPAKESEVVKEVLDASGNSVVDGNGVAQLPNSINKDGVFKIPKLFEGLKYLGAGTQTGAIQITLPQLWTNVIVDFDIVIHNATTREFIEISVGGYLSSANSKWDFTIAKNITSKNLDYTIRFGHNGSKAIVYIGEDNSEWLYSYVSVKNLRASNGSSNFNSYMNPELWVTGWEVSLSQSLENIQSTLGSNFPYADWNKIKSKPQNLLTSTDAANTYVPLDGTTTINNTKTFTASPVIPNPSLNVHAVNKDYLLNVEKPFTAKQNFNGGATAPTPVNPTDITRLEDIQGSTGTGTLLSLAKTVGTNYNYGAASSALEFTVEDIVTNGYAKSLINCDSEPKVWTGTYESDGTTKIYYPKISGATFTANTDMELVVEALDNTNVRYFFLAL